MNRARWCEAGVAMTRTAAALVEWLRVATICDGTGAARKGHCPHAAVIC
jgi:hypothetical protein